MKIELTKHQLELIIEGLEEYVCDAGCRLDAREGGRICRRYGRVIDKLREARDTKPVRRKDVKA